MDGKIFEGLELVFDQIDTSYITGKVYLPIFINESVSEVYGRNVYPKVENEKMLANKNSGYSGNQRIISFIKQLYVEYNIYDNNLLFLIKNSLALYQGQGQQYIIID